jgi:C-terminal processing protease CtpA/Prc
MDLFDLGTRLLGPAGSSLNLRIENVSGQQLEISLRRTPVSAPSRQIRNTVTNQVSCRFGALQMPIKMIELKKPSHSTPSSKMLNLGIVLEWTLQQPLPTVVNVAPGSAAAKARLVVGDILRFINDTPVVAIGRNGIAAALKPIGKLLMLDIHNGNVDAPMQRRVIHVVSSKAVSSIAPATSKTLS